MSFMEYNQPENIQLPASGYFLADLYFDNEKVFQMGCVRQVGMPTPVEEDDFFARYELVELPPAYYITAPCNAVHDEEIGGWQHPTIFQTTHRDNFCYMVWHQTIHMLIDIKHNLPTYITAHVHSEAGDWKSSRYVDKDFAEQIHAIAQEMK